MGHKKEKKEKNGKLRMKILMSKTHHHTWGLRGPGHRTRAPASSCGPQAGAAGLESQCLPVDLRPGPQDPSPGSGNRDAAQEPGSCHPDIVNTREDGLLTVAEHTHMCYYHVTEDIL